MKNDFVIDEKMDFGWTYGSHMNEEWLDECYAFEWLYDMEGHCLETLR